MATNPFDAPSPKASNSNPFDAPTAANLAPPLSPALAHAREAATGFLMKALHRTGEAGMASAARGPGAGFSTLFHGSTPQQYSADEDSALSVVKQHDPIAKHLPDWANRFILEMAADPATYAGGSGALRHLSTTASENALPLAMRISEAAAKKAPASARGAVDAVTQAAGQVHDFVTPGGRNVAHASRELARTQGAEGVRQAQRLYSLKNASSAVGSHLEATLRGMYDSALHGLSPEDETQIYRALHYGRVDKLPDRLKGPAFAVQNVTRSIAYLRGSAPLRKKLESMGFQLPEPVQAFDNGAARGVQNVKQFRENYLPLPHDLNPEEGQKLAAAIDDARTTRRGARNLTNISDSRLKKRMSDEAIILSKPDLYRQAMQGAISSGARTTAAADLRKQLAQHFAPQQVQTFYKRAAEPAAGETVEIGGKKIKVESLSPSVAEFVGKSGKRTASSYKPVQRFAAVPKYIKDAVKTQGREVTPGVGQVIDSLQNAANIGKATLFTSPTPHMKNIATLLGIANPAAFFDAMRTYGKMRAGFTSPAKQFEAVQDAARAGASGVPNVEQSSLVKLLNKGGKAGKAAGKYYNATGKMLWGFDDAAKAALYRQNLATYKDPLIAAYHTQKQMVDYHNVSPMTEKLRLLFPFATWRTTMPAAVAKSVAEHPERVLALDRATGGKFGGAEFTSKDGKKHKFTSPLSETNDLSDFPYGTAKYGRGALSLTAKEALDALLHGIPGVPKKAQNWATYGISPGKYAVKSAPVIGQGLSLGGHGLFNLSPRDELLYLLTGVTSQ